MLKNFRVLNFCVKNFRGLGSTMKFFNMRENGRVRVPAAVVREKVPHLQGRVGSRRRISALFLKRQDKISCKVLGRRRYSVDLPQGGLEIPFVNFRCLKNIVC